MKIDESQMDDLAGESPLQGKKLKSDHKVASVNETKVH